MKPYIIIISDLNGHIWSLQFCPPITHDHSCEISDEVTDIARGAVCNKATLPVAFIEANGRMVKI